VIDVLSKSAIVVRHLHIPIQSGSDTVLKRMRRKYTMSFFADRLVELRKALPDLAITSDVIVGFPGETDEEFMETYHFIKDHRFSELHVFPFSKRTGTPAARMEDQVDEEVKNERVQKLIELNGQLALEYASAFEGTLLEIIPEEIYGTDPENPMVEGYTDNYLKVVIPGDASLIGKIIKVKITKTGYPHNSGQFVRLMDEKAV
jgi:threonylcarbamoyladenosine tRNA methylthiotransferase MtaB